MTGLEEDGRNAQAQAQAEAAQIARIEAIFMSMPDMTRAIYIARRFHDLSIAEIARQTGLSRKQIMRHLTRAVEHLDNALREP